MISATVIGTVGRDAELRQPGGEAQVLNFTIASRRYASGEEATDWVSVSFWGKRAEAIARHVTKGSRVAVRGAMHIREYEHGGVKRWSLELRADDVELLGGRGDQPSHGSRTPGPGPSLAPVRNGPPPRGAEDFDYSGGAGDGTF